MIRSDTWASSPLPVSRCRHLRFRRHRIGRHPHLVRALRLPFSSSKVTHEHALVRLGVVAHEHERSPVERTIAVGNAAPFAVFLYPAGAHQVIDGSFYGTSFVFVRYDT